VVELADSGSFETELHGVTVHKTELFLAALSVHTTPTVWYTGCDVSEEPLASEISFERSGRM
jgi:hypothetical protein